MEESGRIGKFPKTTIKKANELLSFNVQFNLATWGDQERSELICSPRYLTDETIARGVPSTVMQGGGSLEFLFLVKRIYYRAAFCRLQRKQGVTVGRVLIA